MSKYEEGNSYDFGVELKDAYKLICSCEFNEIKNGQAILGYVLNKNIR